MSNKITKAEVVTDAPKNGLIGRKVILMRCHAPLHILGAGELRDVIALKETKFKRLDMVLCEYGVYMTGLGSQPDAKEFEVLVPFSMIKSTQLEV